MAYETSQQKAVREAHEARQAAEQERQERLDEINRLGMERVAAKDAAKAAELAQKQAEVKARIEARQQAEYDALKRQYRARFKGPDSAFEAVWPDVLARITAAQSVRRVTRL